MTSMQKNISFDQDIEAWVVNSVKAKMIIKLDCLLDCEGRNNARKLFLVPIFTIAGLIERVEEQAPEMRTLFFRELAKMTDETERRV